jgi:REP element-mobilizing transposase RayT
MPKSFYRRNLPHLQRDYKPHFLTFCTYQRWTLPDWARTIVLNACTHNNQGRFDLHAVVVMPDHVHIIFTPLIDQSNTEIFSLAKITQPMKAISAHEINARLGRHGQIWQEESFDRVLRSSEKLDEKVAYILNNPVRKGLANTPAEYPWLWLPNQPASKQTPAPPQPT